MQEPLTWISCAGNGATFTNYFTMSPVFSPQMRASGMGLDPRSATWPRCLMQVGYITALMEKWHLGSPPTRHGYQEFVGRLVVELWETCQLVGAERKALCEALVSRRTRLS